MVTASALQRLAADWSTKAGEPVRVEYIKGTVYGFASELGALRLFHAYNGVSRNQRTHARHSTAQGSWYFSIETDL